MILIFFIWICRFYYIDDYQRNFAAVIVVAVAQGIQLGNCFYEWFFRPRSRNYLQLSLDFATIIVLAVCSYFVWPKHTIEAVCTPSCELIITIYFVPCSNIIA